jgi:thymidine phosphorylase
LERPVRALITDMHQPLGRMIGNSLEVIETIDCLKGGGPEDVRELTLELAAEMLILGEKATSHDEARRKSEEALASGAAWNRFLEMVKLQGGDVACVEEPEKLNVTDERAEFKAAHAGHITHVDCRAVGNAAVVLGAGRAKTTDEVDHGVGFEVHKRIGDEVSAGEPIMTVYHRGGRGLDDCMARLQKAYGIGERPPATLPLILERL